MALRKSLLSALLTAAAAGVAGCGGGGGGSGGSGPVPTPTPFVVNARPLSAGDSFKYAGTTTKTDVYTGTSPHPQATFAYTVAQSVAVSGPAAVPPAFGGSASAYDFQTTELDTSPLEQTRVITNAYYAMSGSDLITYGSSATDSNGETVTIAYANPGNGNGLVDILPERSGQSWSNTNAQTLTESSTAAQQTATRTYAADGSYVDNATYTATGIQTAITEAADGSGSYAFSQGGSPIYSISLSAPQAGTGGSVITIAQTSNASGTPQTTTQTVGVWYPQPVALYTETDVDDGETALPTSCGTTPNVGTLANQIVRTTQQVDTVLGTIERISEKSYVVPTFGVACVQLGDVLTSYYDYSGQSASFPSFGSRPVETQTIATTVGLTAAVTPSGTALRQSASRAAGLRLADARSAFFTAVEHEKLLRRRAVVERIVRSLQRGARP